MVGRKSRQIIDRDIHDGKLPEGYGYCRVCRTIKTEVMFGKAVDLDIDTNSLLSVCKECINTLFSKILTSENGSLQNATLIMCRKMGIKYDERAIDSTLMHIQTKETDPTKFFNLYRAKLLAVNKTDIKGENLDLTYQYVNEGKITIDESKFINDDFKNMDDLRKFWGKGFEPEEIMILEEKFSEYSQTNSIDTHPERVLLKYICLKELEIDKALSGGGKGSTATLTKEYQELLKSANISPSSTTASMVGKAQESWGMFMKTIEEKEPAEVFDDDKLFKDYDNIEQIWLKYIVRPIKNFITGSRDFNVEDIESDYEDESNEDIEPIAPLEYKAEE